jgi:hypothetical protein
MINHARTLLLNKDGNKRPGTDFYLEEFVDPTFRVLSYSQELTELRTVLVGRSPDDGYLNFRLRQYMTLLDSTEFVTYVEALDPRITYTGQSPDVQRTYNKATALQAEPTSSSSSSSSPSSGSGDILFVGDIVTLPSVVYYKWRIDVIAPFVVRTTFNRTQQYVDTVVTISDGITSPIAMAGQPSFNVRIRENVSLRPGDAWNIESFVAPTDDMAGVVTQLNETNPQYLGYVFPSTEPYKTFKDLWKKQEILSYQLSGLLLAWIYRAEEERLHG